MQKIELNEEQIKNLHSLGKTPEEIGVEMGVSGSVIRLRLKDFGLKSNRKLTKKSQELLDQIRDLVLSGKTNQDIANELHICATTVRKYTYELGLDTNSIRTKTLTKKEIHLTQEQLEVLYGSLLGDMSLDINWKNARPIISQGGEQEAYFDYKCEIFKNLIGKPNKSDRYDKRTGKWYHKYYVRFLTNPFYTKLKEELYPNGIKTISQNWLNKITERGLAFWFMDDGTNAGTIATNCFTLEECELIKLWFKEKWKIETTIQKSNNNGNEQNLIYIRTNSRPTFYNLVKKYMIPSMMYKLKNWNP